MLFYSHLSVQGKIAFTIHLASNRCPYVYNLRHLFAGNPSLYMPAVEIPLIHLIQLPTGQLGVLQDRHTPLHRTRIASCRSDLIKTFTSGGATCTADNLAFNPKSK